MAQLLLVVHQLPLSAIVRRAEATKSSIATKHRFADAGLGSLLAPQRQPFDARVEDGPQDVSSRREMILNSVQRSKIDPDLAVEMGGDGEDLLDSFWPEVGNRMAHAYSDCTQIAGGPNRWSESSDLPRSPIEIELGGENDILCENNPIEALVTAEIFDSPQEVNGYDGASLREPKVRYF